MTLPLPLLLSAVMAQEPPPQVALVGYMNPKSVDPLIAFFQKDAENPVPLVQLQITSGGGSLFEGLSLIDAMQAARAAGTRIVCTADYAYSMAAVVFEGACDVRRLKLAGDLCFHEVAYDDSGLAGQRLTKTLLRALADDLEGDDKRLADLVAPRVRMTAQQYLDWIAGHDRYVKPQDALEHDFVDTLTP